MAAVGATPLPDVAHHGSDGQCCLAVGFVVARNAARGLGNGGAHQQGDQQSGQPDDKECRLPAFDLAEQRHAQNIQRLHVGDHRTAQHVGEPGADGDAQHVDRQGAPQHRARKIVGDHRVGGRAQGRLADADAHSSKEQGPERLGETAQRGHKAPHGDAQRDQVAPVTAVGDARQGNAHDHAIQKREGLRQQQHEDHVPGVQARRGRVCARWC